MRMIIKWLICSGALLAAYALFPDHLYISGGMLGLAAAATVLWIANLAIRPILQLIALPITLLTFGLFSIIVNAGVVSMTDWLLPVIDIRGFALCLLIAVLISIGNGLFTANLRRKN